MLIIQSFSIRTWYIFISDLMSFSRDRKNEIYVERWNFIFKLRRDTAYVDNY